MGRKTVGRFVLDTQTPISVGANSNIIFTDATISTNSLEYNAATGEIKIKTPGLYMIYANFTVSIAEDNQARVVLLENGLEVPGAKTSVKVSQAGDDESMSFNAITTIFPAGGCEYATLTFENIFEVNYQIANVIIEKVA